MLLETAFFALNKLNGRKKKEKFTETENNKDDGGAFFVILAILQIMFTIIFMIIMFVNWIRFVYIAFGCSKGEGFLAIFLTSMWVGWKVGTLIKNSCKSAAPTTSSLF
jgi:hypothetical protein